MIMVFMVIRASLVIRAAKFFWLIKGGEGYSTNPQLDEFSLCKGGLIPSAPDMQISIRRSLLNQYRFFSVSLISRKQACDDDS